MPRSLHARKFAGFVGPLRVLALCTLVISAGCISEEREREIGTTMASEVNPHLPLIEDPQLNAYLQTLGRRIGEVSGRPELDYTFYIINTDVVNAFALPGGHIYLTRGLIGRTSDGSELSGILAHEIGHVAARHGVQKLQRHLRTGSLVNVLYNTILGGEPALLRENSLQLADVIWTAEHSRRDEREADRLAVRYLIDAGVDPTGVVTLLETLLAEEEAHVDELGRLETWLSSHPLTATRIADAREDIRNLVEDEVPGNRMKTDNFALFRELVLRHSPEAVPPAAPFDSAGSAE